MDALDTDRHIIFLDEIILHVLKYIQTKRLLHFRLISRQWNGLVKTTLRKRENLVVHLNGDLDRNRRFLEYLNPELEPSEHEEVDADVIIPSTLKIGTHGLINHVKNPIDPFERRQLTPVYMDKVVNICQILGNQGKHPIKHLQIDWCSWFTYESGEDRPHQAVTNLWRNLEVLEFLQKPHFRLVNEDSWVSRDNFHFDIPEIEPEPETNFEEKSACSLRKLVIGGNVQCEGNGSPDPNHPQSYNVNSHPRYPRVLCSSEKTLGFLSKGVPNLREVEIKDEHSCDTIFRALHKEGILPQITNLRMRCFCNEILDTLSEMDRPTISRTFASLEHFHVDRFERRIPNPDFIVESQAPYLKSVTMHSYSHGSIPMKHFPNLEQLTLRLPDAPFPVYALQNVDFKLDLPRVKMVEIFQNHEFQEYDDEEDDLSPETKQSLISGLLNEELLHGHASQTVVELRLNLPGLINLCASLLRNMFPRVRTLVLYDPSMGFLTGLYSLSTWADLEELELHFRYGWSLQEYKTWDFALFGIAKAVDITDSLRPDLYESQGDEGRWWEEYDVNLLKEPSLRNLTKLRRLVFNSFGGSGPGWMLLSDFSVHFGFLDLKELRTLRINKSNIYSTTVDHLRENLPYIVDLEIGTMKNEHELLLLEQNGN